MSTTFNVLRWSSLAAGVVYGVYHNQVLKSAGKEKEEQAEYAHKQKLIAEAKAEYAKLNAPAETKTEAIGSLNLDDPNIDFAKVILGAVEGLKN
ncbi:hypothetical protein PACTADRAFT_49900 [Pachysolen tannophilus NRRL Y-2460]|uniref:ATP synthase F(0) complex subunit e, mitochondrial n=1 Tax=Pachysolen tannophilus NRRL Y-2460 TaxID=669874 RepID=A0A1E4TTU0_PACTA|nr:hypothetical protein PACTADRAFT_49900 [Pachysolen tannophilus NRRL Y-2460]